MKRRLLAVLGFASGILAGTVAVRRSFARRPERVDVYVDDGSMISVAAGSAEADALLSVARDALAAARS